MRHRRHRDKLGVKTKHRKALVRNLVRSLVLQKQIRTTVSKARAASSFAEKMVTLAKRGDLHARRLLISRLGCEDASRILIQDIAPKFKDRNGGYTRMLRLVPRRNDGAPMALLEFSERIEVAREPKKEKKPKKKKVEKPEAGKEKAKPVKGKPEEVEKIDKVEKKESEKKGGFLSKLRKYLKGEEE